MHLSTRGRYAVMAMLDLAELANSSDGPVTLAQIAERQRISLSYLEQLFARLRKGGVVASVRGPGGGYTLARGAAQISIAEIVKSVDEEIDLTRCKSFYKLNYPVAEPEPGKGCVAGKKCNAHALWDALGRQIELFLERVTLQAVLDGEAGAELDIPLPARAGTRVQIN